MSSLNRIQLLMRRKTCCRCRKSLSIAMFYRDRTHKDGLKSACKVCQPPVKFTSSQHRIHSWTKRYGITQKEYNTMLNNQQGKCAICKRDASEFNRKLSIDHDHTTGNIRGLLCMQCNLILGNARDNIDVLKNSILYLEKTI